MPKQISADELDAVLRAVALFPIGAAVEEINNALGLPRRTLQRRLALLVKQKRLRSEGAGRGSRYRLAAVADEPAPRSSLLAGTSIDLPVSAEGEALRKAVRAPIQQRHPVGYRRAFLHDYRPNETAYLPLALRERLAASGTSASGELPAGTHARQILGRLLIDLSWNSSRLEGNTYSLLGTERLLELGESAVGMGALTARHEPGVGGRLE